MAGLDLSFGLFEFEIPTDNNVLWAAGEDKEVQFLFEEYGIESYKHFDHIKLTSMEVLIPVISIFGVIGARLFYYWITRSKYKRNKQWRLLKFSAFFNAPIRFYYEFILDMLITALLNTRLNRFKDGSDVFSLVMAILTMMGFLFVSTIFFLMMKKCNMLKFPQGGKEFLAETKEDHRTAIIQFAAFMYRRLFLSINVIMFNIFSPNLALSIHCFVQFISVGFLSNNVYENWFRTTVNLIMEYSTLITFLSMIWFHNKTHNQGLTLVVVIVLVGSQLLVSLLCLGEGIGKMIMTVKGWYKKRTMKDITAA